jgi:serine/threonine protein kinase
MAPEILRSEKYDVSSDLWSVGCILFQCLVGRAPFVVSTHYELIKKLEKEDAVVPPEIRSQISGDCFNLVMRLLDKNRDSRIGWDAFFKHPWFGSAAAAAAAAAAGGMGTGVGSGMVGSSLDLSSSSSSSGHSHRAGGGGHWPMEAGVPSGS